MDNLADKNNEDATVTEKNKEDSTLNLKKRSILSTKKRCKIALVADHRFFKEVGNSNAQLTTLHMVRHLKMLLKHSISIFPNAIDQCNDCC